MILIFILILNILFLYFTQSSKKYWLIPIIIWVILILLFIGFRMYMNIECEKLENLYWENTSKIKFDELNDLKDSIIENNMLLIKLIGFQTFITFIFQNIGFYKTEHKKTYKWTALIFAILTLICILTYLLIGIVPTSGIIG